MGCGSGRGSADTSCRRATWAPVGVETRSDSRRSRLARSAAESRTSTDTGSRAAGASRRATGASRPRARPASPPRPPRRRPRGQPSRGRARGPPGRASASSDVSTSTTPGVSSKSARTRFATSSRACGRGAVDLRHHRVEDRRAGRDLDHLHPRAPPSRDLHQGGPKLLGDVVALEVAVVLAPEVHLEVGPLGRAAQEVVADEAVEVHGRGGAGVELDVAHLRRPCSGSGSSPAPSQASPRGGCPRRGSRGPAARSCCRRAASSP